MPRSKRTAVYGPEYEQLLLTAHKECAKQGAHAYLLQLPSPQHALQLKSKVYAYFNALRKEANRPDLVIFADQLSLTITGDFLEFFRREDSWDAKAIRNALGLKEGFSELGGPAVATAPSAQTSALDRLHDMRNSKIMKK